MLFAREVRYFYSMDNVVEAHNVNKRYGQRHVLKDFSLSLRRGRVTALLGPNGAGKTTFVKLLLNLVRVTSGKILLNGQPPQLPSSRLKTAFLPAEFRFFPYYRVIDTLRFYGKMAGLKGGALEQATSRALTTAKMEREASGKMGKLSTGMLQRVGIACTLVGGNDFFIFDEPFSGLDPLGIKDFKTIVMELKKEGKSVLINSHILSEMEKICDDVAIVKEGVLLAAGENGMINGTDSLEDFFCKSVEGGT